MATVARGTAGVGFRPSFHFWMALLMALFVFGGFGMTYLGPLAAGTFPPAPPVVHLHGVVFFAWTLLLMVQSLLVNLKNVRLHRSLGTFGIALAAIVFAIGLLITIVWASIGVQGPDDLRLFYLSLVAPPSFAVLFAMAIQATRTPQVHRNLILLAMVSILMPGINRFYMMLFGLGSVPFYTTYLTMDAMLVAILWHEHRATRSISRATCFAAAIIVVPQFLMSPVASSTWFPSVPDWLGTLVYYR